MKNLLCALLLLTSAAKAQNTLTFNVLPINCEDKCVVYPMAKDSTYIFGFVYLDAVAGLTLNYEGKLEIDNEGNLLRTMPVEHPKVGVTKFG
ncbi:hypothetical protein ABIB40_000475 [Pedobacter sp. UYP30]|uniref:hypothetical protein n=1 Tax=Pedobacter sp. UYP30 TaxID=1756400 RepID=UPI0033932CC6